VRLYNESEAEVRLYFSSCAADAWSRILEKRLNQRGFHEMFKPIKKLGKGNFATVYEAERVTDRVRFAVKAFSKQNSYCAKNGKESLINELAVLRELNREPHPNVLKLEAVFESENSIYVVLELLPGQTLFQTIQERKGNFSKEEVKTITGGLLAGLSHIHDNRVMHRDLKPENIMLRRTGGSLEPVMATKVDIKEYLFFRCGTPGYVAPEIIKLTASEHVEPACDVFSLGAIFHILLVRKALFEGSRYD
jgi:serine/threonine protein kinase